MIVLTRQTDRQTDHDLVHLVHLFIDNLDPNVPLWNAVQDLYGTGPIQEIWAIVDHIGLSPGNMNELDRTDQESCLS